MTGIARTRALVLTYGLVSATLYSSLLPLWEGFDEFYHYGYVQYLSTTATFPTVGKSMVSRELWTSLDFAPVSHFIQPYFHRASTSLQEYFRWSADERRARRAHLDSIDPALQREPSPLDNYEVKQAPLTYLLLAPLNRLLRSVPLSLRVLVLRLVLAISTIVLLWIGTRGLARRLSLEGGMETAALLVIFSCQMIYAVACHIANDALVLPWLVFFLCAVIDSCESPSLHRMTRAAFLMAIGLLIKASVLVLAPLAFVAPVVCRKRPVLLFTISGGILLALAGPWYLRNVLVYHNLTATNDTTSGVGVQELAHAAIALPWRQSFGATAHSALWTGNSSFTTFSASTLNVLLVLLVISGVLYYLRARWSIAEVVTSAALVLYSAGLIVIALSFFQASRGSIIAPMPWYMQVLLAPVILLCFLGLLRWQCGGRWIAIGTVLVWAYVAAVGWLAKLFPMYGGFDDPHARPRQLLNWYIEKAAQRNSILSTLCPAPVPALYILLAAVLCLTVVCAITTCFGLSHASRSSRG